MLDPSAKSFNTHLCFPVIPNDHSDSGVCSPTLWRTSPPRSPPRHRPEDYWSLSPDSKAQAIARGQRELMEMVSKMPESCYELSLKDIVEVRGNEENDRKVFDEMPRRTTNRPSKVVRKTKSDKWVDPNRNSGFLLKMMFPVSLGSKKDTSKKKKKTKKTKKKKEDSQVSPRPSISEESVKGEDRDWWNRLSDSRGSASTKRSSSISSSSSYRSRSSLRDENSSCLSFLWSVRPSRD